MMEAREMIEFRKVRDVGDVLNVTFTFLRQNIVKLGKSLLFFVAPAMAIVSAFSAQFQTLMFDPEAILDFNFGLLGVVYLLSVLASAMAVTVVLGYVMLYQDHGPDSFEVRDVWAMATTNFMRMLGTMLYLLFLLVVLMFLLVLIVGVFVGLLTSGGGGSIGIVVMVIFIYIAMLVALSYFGVVLAMIFPMRLREDIGLRAATRRCFALVKDRWWMTFLVLLVGFMVYGTTSMIFGMPYYVMLFAGQLHGAEGGGVDGLLTALSILASLGATLLYSVPLTALAFQYFNLVEQKERTGLLARIEAVGAGEDEAASGDPGASSGDPSSPGDEEAPTPGPEG